MTRGWRALLPAALALAAACGGPDPAPRRPNVLVVFTDDQRFDSLSITGNPWIETPHLDRIAREGVLFRRAYATTSRCCPGRASFLTGEYAMTHGVWTNHPEHDLLEEQRTFADELDAAGYDTAWIGKWHLPNPGAGPVRGFDHWVSYEGPGSHFDQTFNVDGRTVPSEGFQADRLTDYALEFLQREREGPFLLVLALKNPHVPMTPAPRHAGRLDGAEIEVPASAADPPASLPIFYRSLRVADGRHAIEDLAAYQDEVRRYWELVLSIDDNVGRVLSALEERGELDDTLVVLTTDNGQMLGEHGLQQKGLAYEPSIRIPLAMRWPRAIPAGTVTDHLALNIDLFPTFLEAAGVPQPAAVQGESLLPLARGEDEGWREDFLYVAPGFGGEGGMIERAIVGDRWKYVSFAAPGGTDEALYDLVRDPDERVNAVGDPAAEPILEWKRERMREERERLGDRP